jgi:hypothetical protein
MNEKTLDKIKAILDKHKLCIADYNLLGTISYGTAKHNDTIDRTIKDASFTIESNKKLIRTKK